MPNLHIIQLQKILLASSSEPVRLRNQANNACEHSRSRSRLLWYLPATSSPTSPYLSASLEPPNPSVRKVLVKSVS